MGSLTIVAKRTLTDIDSVILILISFFKIIIVLRSVYIVVLGATCTPVLARTWLTTVAANKVSGTGTSLDILGPGAVTKVVKDALLKVLFIVVSEPAKEFTFSVVETGFLTSSFSLTKTPFMKR